MRWASLLLVVALVPVWTCGCALFLLGAAAGAGAATVAYVKSDLEAQVDADPREVVRAAEKAFDSLDVRRISSNASALDGEVVGRTATDTRVAVTIKAGDGAGGGTKLSIRVGYFGDEAMSRRVYDEMQKHLPRRK